ncbi:MAG: protein kinase domain-containing protein [Planctomycetota bacterium]|jgi:serine/threonine-protein kinase
MDTDPLIGKTVGSFRIESKIGEGGMGAVYHAIHTRLEREAAFKVLPAHLMKGNRNLVDRFFIEARAAAKLDHPNVVKVYDAEEVEGLHYIAMEYVRGPDVKELLHDRGPLNSMEGLEIALQAAKGLRAAHAEKIIHRDVKPANLMLTAGGVIKVADFGLARNVDAASHPTQSGQVVGTPAYMSPEQADGKKADFRSDIYSLGVTLFEMVTGSVPFWAETSLAILRAHVEAPVPDPVAFNGEVSPLLTPLVKRMMAKSREERFPSYDALIEEIAGIKKTLASGPLFGPVDTDTPTLTLSRLLAPTPGGGAPPAPEGGAPEAPRSDPTPATRHPLEGISITKVTHHDAPRIHPAFWVGDTVVLLASVTAIVLALASVFGGGKPDGDVQEKAVKAPESGDSRAPVEGGSASSPGEGSDAPGERPAEEAEQRKKKYDSFAEVARSLEETLPEEALKNWGRALEYADSDADREVAKDTIDGLTDAIRERREAEAAREAQRRYDDLFRAVKGAMKGRRFREVENLLKKAEGLRPDDPDLRETLKEHRFRAAVTEGMHLENNKDWIGARNAYERALDLFPGRGAVPRMQQKVNERITRLSERFGGVFMVPDGSRDQHGNPVVTRRGGLHTDPETNLPYEIWLLRPTVEFVLVSAGSFRMGTRHEEEPEHWKYDEKPAHEVTVTDRFYLGKYEVTQAQWRAFMGSNPSEHKGTHRPVDSVTWLECAAFCERLTKSARETLPGVTLRLPSEAEWEYAVRASTTTRFHFGDDEREAKPWAWFVGNAVGETHPVGKKAPNPWGLYDMLGNVSEWCADPHWPHKAYKGAPSHAKPWLIEGKESVCRIRRGGCGGSPARHLRSAFRASARKDDSHSWGGFRLALDLKLR